MLASPQGGDFFLGVDGSDHTMAATGTNKDVLFEDLGAAIQGLKFMTGTGALGSTAGTITATDIANAVSAGYQGMWLDSRFVWDLSTLVIENVSNFTIASAMVGSIGWSGLTTYRSTGYCITDTGSPADGVQIWADNTHNTQGIRLKGLAFVGTNSRAVVHIGGKARRVTMDDCFVYNTNVAGTTVASGAGTAIGSVTTLTVAASSTTAFASSGALVVTTVIGAPTPAVPASTVGYTSTLNQAIQVVITGGTMTNVTINGSTVGSGAGTYTLPALGTITMTYTVAPTWAWSSLGLGVLAYTGKTTGTFTGCTLISGVGSLSTLTGMNMVNQAAFGLLDDTSLTVTSPSNSEKNTFKGCDFAALNGVPIGIDVWGISQHANDSIWIDIQTAVGAAGLVSIIATGGGGQQWYNA
ncbi:MAG TPA: hypothetical protein VHU17_01640, partial [Acidimicrobiales bacterium]|nr:hypothetical protein [Acidimicrobiales bacterium]